MTDEIKTTEEKQDALVDLAEKFMAIAREYLEMNSKESAGDLSKTLLYAGGVFLGSLIESITEQIPEESVKEIIRANMAQAVIGVIELYVDTDAAEPSRIITLNRDIVPH